MHAHVGLPAQIPQAVVELQSRCGAVKKHPGGPTIFCAFHSASYLSPFVFHPLCGARKPSTQFWLGHRIGHWQVFQVTNFGFSYTIRSAIGIGNAKRKGGSLCVLGTCATTMHFISGVSTYFSLSKLRVFLCSHRVIVVGHRYVDKGCQIIYNLTGPSIRQPARPCRPPDGVRDCRPWLQIHGILVPPDPNFTVLQLVISGVAAGSEVAGMVPSLDHE